MIKLHFTKTFGAGALFPNTTYQDCLTFPDTESADRFRQNINRYEKRNKYFCSDFRIENLS